MDMHLPCWKAALKAMLMAMAMALPWQGAIAGTQWGADYFPDIVLTTQDGDKVRFYDDLVKGKNVAVNVIYTSCRDECPLETARMAELQRLLGERMGRDIFFLSISIDPEKDTPKVLKAYAGKFGVGPGWLFLTGKKQDIKVLTRKLGLSRSSDAFSKDGHASSLMLGNDPGGQWMRNSAVDNPRFLAATMANFFGWKDVVPTASYAQARPLDLGRAQFTFESRCASCHTIGQGDRIGPDLNQVTVRRSPAWVARYLKEPEKVLAEGDPSAVGLSKRYQQVRMPNLRLGDEDVAALIRYLDQQGKPAGTARDTPVHGQHSHAQTSEPLAQKP
ncbi:SCO family protein [Polaromonas glacialis]|uniref:SCO family protein n=1 Tax=Polaromonas glacialis TaxID=866564 RepID=UPI000691BA7B|nr:SCO family protein [Polaromonas glacialis]